jgi:hypothetical protein
VREVEHRSHRDLDRSPVERIGTPGREQNGVEPQRGHVAEHRADVGVVDEVLDNHDPACAVEDVESRPRFGTLECGQGASVDVKAGQRLDLCLVQHEARRVRAAEHVRESVEPPRRHQERARPMSCLDGTAHDLLALGEVDAAL